MFSLKLVPVLFHFKKKKSFKERKGIIEWMCMYP